MKLDTSDLQKAMERLRKERKLTKKAIVERAAKGFIKEVVALTPPASKGVTGASAKKAGEATINEDTGLTMEVVSDKQLQRMEDMHGSVHAANTLKNKKGEVYLEDLNYIIRSTTEALRFHMDKRSKRTGRVPSATKRGGSGQRIRMRTAGEHNGHVGRSRADNIALVPKKVMAEVRKILKRQVGVLAAGWNTAAKQLGVKLPAWISRHGTAYGECIVTITENTFRLEISNVVQFVENVRGYEARIEKAIAFQAKKMDREADFLIQKALKRSGW